MTYSTPAPGGIVDTVGGALAAAFRMMEPTDRHALALQMRNAPEHHVGGRACCIGFVRASATAVGFYSEDHLAREVGRFAALAVLDGEVDQLLEGLPATSPWDVVRAGLAALHRAGPDAIRAALAEVEDPRIPILADGSTEIVGYA